MRAIILLPLICAACATTQAPVPAVQLQTITRTVEVQRPCAVTVPKRPAPLARPLPADAVALAALLGEKLIEWSGPGGYGERADAALTICTKP